MIRKVLHSKDKVKKSFIDFNDQEINALPRDKTLFLIPFGSLEERGPHLPWSYALRLAEAMVQEFKTKIESNDRFKDWNVFILPSISLSVDGHSTSKNIFFRPHVVRDSLVDLCRGLSKLGFLHFVSVSGNLSPKQLSTLEDAAKLIRSPLRKKKENQSELISLSSALIDWDKVKASPFWLTPKDHGGEKDTSIAIYLDSLDVDPSYAHLVENPAETPTFLNRFIIPNKNQGYIGDPSKATREKGEALFQSMCSELIEKLEDYLKGVSDRNTFRSWYSVFPQNKSFFKAWILSFAILLILLLWIVLSVQWIFSSV